MKHPRIGTVHQPQFPQWIFLDVLKLLRLCKRLWRSSIICFQATKEPSTYLDHKDGLPTALFNAMPLEHSMYVLVIAGVKGFSIAIRSFFDRICLRTGNQRSSNKLRAPLWAHIQSGAFIKISVILQCVFYHWDVGKQIYDVNLPRGLTVPLVCY